MASQNSSLKKYCTFPSFPCLTCFLSPCHGWYTSTHFPSPADGTRWCKGSQGSPEQQRYCSWPKKTNNFPGSLVFIPHVLHVDDQPHNFCWLSTRRTPLQWCLRCWGEEPHITMPRLVVFWWTDLGVSLHCDVTQPLQVFLLNLVHIVEFIEFDWGKGLSCDHALFFWSSIACKFASF